MKFMVQTGIGWKRGKSSNPVNSLLSCSPIKVITYLGFGPLRITSTAWKKRSLFSDDELILSIFRIGLRDLNKLGQILRINSVNVHSNIVQMLYENCSHNIKTILFYSAKLVVWVFGNVYFIKRNVDTLSDSANFS